MNKISTYNKIMLIVNVILVYVFISDIINLYSNNEDYIKIYGNNLTTYKTVVWILIATLLIHLIVSVYFFTKNKETKLTKIFLKINTVFIPVLFLGMLISSKVLF